MTGPTDRPRWQAVEVGPGGVPPDSVQPRPSGAPGPWAQRSEPQDATSDGDLPPAWRNWTAAAPPADPAPRRALHGPAGKLVAVLATLAVLVGLALWSNAARPLRGPQSAQVAVGDCLSSSGRQIDGSTPCGDASADFRVVGRYPGTDDPGECSASPADLAVVQFGPTLLCVNFVAGTGDCLLLGRQSGDVGKVDCVSGTTGEYRVRAVLKNSIDPDRCPSGTTRTLVHRYNSEVLCLSRS